MLDTNLQPPQLVSLGLSRVVVSNAIRLESVNGPLVTTIWGGQLTNEVGAVTNNLRCVFMGTNAVLSGFTLTNGDAVYGGGVCCESATAVVSNCTVSCCLGGGANRGTLYNCTLMGNSVAGVHNSGGGAYKSTLYNCTLTRNCVLSDTVGNSLGGGAYECTLNNCTLTSNYVSYFSLWWEGDWSACGGGAYGGTLNNCILSGNSARGWAQLSDGSMPLGYGGGAFGSTLNNCTVSGNSADFGGGVSGGTLYNCIVYFNTDGGNYESSALNYCCTTPMPTDGVGNFTNAPLFVNAAGGDFRLLPNSPFIDAGTNLTELITTDILGLPRPMDGNADCLARFDIGAYEFNPYRFQPTLHLTANGFHFTVCGEPNRFVRIERSRDFVNWEFAGQVPIPIGGQTLIDPVATSEPRLFYRAMRVP